MSPSGTFLGMYVMQREKLHMEAYLYRSKIPTPPIKMR